MHGKWVYEHQMGNRIGNQVLSLLSPVLTYHQGYSLTYPSIIFDVAVSTFLNKDLCCVVMAFACCNVQGSPLRGGGNILIFKPLWLKLHTLVSITDSYSSNHGAKVQLIFTPNVTLESLSWQYTFLGLTKQTHRIPHLVQWMHTNVLHLHMLECLCHH